MHHVLVDTPLQHLHCVLNYDVIFFCSVQVITRDLHHIATNDTPLLQSNR